MEENTPPVSRRAFLRTVTTSAGTAFSVSSVATAQQETVVELKSNPFIFKGATESPLYITPGTTVKFKWVSDGHNIHVDTQPQKANWKGVEKIHDTGFTHTHTFEVKGKYHFWCVPHKPLGMIGDIIVNESGQPPGAGGGGRKVPEFPDSAKTLGIAAVSAMGSVLGLTYFVIKYGGDYGDFAEE